MSKALALLALTVLSAAYAVEVPQPSWTNHNRIAGSQQMMTNFKPWAEAVGSTIGDKRDKDDLAVYEVVRTENTDWTWTSENKELADELNAKGTKPVWIAEEGFWDDVSPLPESFIFNGGDFSSGRDSLVVTIKFANGSDDNIRATATRPRYMDEMLTNVVDRLATTNGVAAAISANEKTGTNEQVVRGELWQDSTWLIQVENADFARLALADEEGHNIMDTYATKSEVDDKADRATTLSGYGITDAAPLSMISETDPTFSNAVLAVGLNIDTNSVAVLNEIASTFGGFPLGGTATTVGGLLAALAAAIAWLKKNKVGSFESAGGASATVENGVAKLDDFFTESNSLLTGRVNTLIDAKVGDVNAVLAAALDGTEVA